MRLKRLPAVFSLLDDDRAVTVQQIGKGRFTTAYQELQTDTVYLRVKSGDSSKFILENCDGPYIPVLQRAGDIGDDTVWKTRRYERLSAKHKAAWRQFRQLSEANIKAGPRMLDVAWNSPNHCHGHEWMWRTINKLEANPQVDLGLIEALKEIANSAANYGASYIFEFAKRNLAVDGTGHLILLDPIFDLEEVARQQKRGGLYAVRGIRAILGPVSAVLRLWGLRKRQGQLARSMLAHTSRDR